MASFLKMMAFVKNSGHYYRITVLNDMKICLVGAEIIDFLKGIR